MRVLFAEPPASQRTGGLDAAIEGLAVAIGRLGWSVTRGSTGSNAAEKFEVVHFHGLWQPRFASLARKLRKSGKPYVVSPHGMLEPWAWRHKAWKKWPYYYLVERRFLAGASSVLATAESEAKTISGLLPGRRVDVLALGLTGSASPDYVAARARLGIQAEERVLLFLSRIHIKKGLDMLLEALTTTSAPVRTRLIVVGGGDAAYVQSLKSFAAVNQSRLPRVDWLGEIWGDPRWTYFQAADLFCLPSHSENFGLAVLEALQVGTPVLTTRATPWAEHLSEGRGFRIDPTIESIRAGLAQFFTEPLSSDHAREARAAWARQGFSWGTLAPRYAALYQELCRTAPREGADQAA